jgi:hypothetical protein
LDNNIIFPAPALTAKATTNILLLQSLLFHLQTAGVTFAMPQHQLPEEVAPPSQSSTKRNTFFDDDDDNNNNNRNDIDKLESISFPNMLSKKQKIDLSATTSSSPPSDAGSFKKQSRATNFTETEDEILCKAHVNNVSTDSSVGNNQKASVFWLKVKEKFVEQLEQAGIQRGVERDVKSLTNRFTRHIAPSVTNLNRFLRQVKKEKPSGTPEEEYLDVAIQRYEETLQKNFLQVMCPHSSAAQV